MVSIQCRVQIDQAAMASGGSGILRVPKRPNETNAWIVTGNGKETTRPSGQATDQSDVVARHCYCDRDWPGAGLG